jgi:hypothetical protein
MGGVAGHEGVERQRRQREVVDHLRFVVAVAKIADVLCVWDVGFSYQDHVGCDVVQRGAQQLDDAMGLRQVDAACARLLPHEADGVEAD